MKLKRVHPRGGTYELGKYTICREPLRSEGGSATKVVWHVWENNLMVDGFPTLRDAVQAIERWHQLVKDGSQVSKGP